MKHLSAEELEIGFDHVMETPLDGGELQMIVRRPEVNEREIIATGSLDVESGLMGDNWKTRGSKATEDGSAHPRMQLNIMNSRVIDLVSQSKDRWQLAGDQLFVDMNLSPDNLPPFTRLSLGTAIIEVSEVPHKGCAKFVERFGKDAMIFVNSRRGKSLNLRGINAVVVQNGEIQSGDVLKKI